MASPADIEAFAAALPKVELHVHLVGSMSLETARALGGDGEVPRLRSAQPSFADFAVIYGRRQRLVRSGADVALLVERLAQRLAANRVDYAEVTLTPLAHLDAGMPARELAEALTLGRSRAARESGVELAWVFDVSGELGLGAAMRTLDWVLRHAPDGTVGFGLGGPERGVARAAFAPAFDRAIAAGLRSVPHAGEDCGPQSVWSALTDLRAERIGHGIRSVDDPALLERLAESGVALEVCPTSNVRTGAVAAIDHHPLRRLVEAGVNVTLATDNPGIFETDLNDEYVLAHRALGLSAAQLVGIAAAGIDAAFCRAHLRRDLSEALDRLAA